MFVLGGINRLLFTWGKGFSVCCSSTPPNGWSWSNMPSLLETTHLANSERSAMTATGIQGEQGKETRFTQGDLGPPVGGNLQTG